MSDRFAHNLLSGGIAGSLEIATTWPFEYAKTQLQLPQRKHTTMWGCISSTIQNKGIRTLYGGLPPVFLSEFPKIGVRFGSYQYLDDHKLIESNFMKGLVAGAVEAILVTTPAETLKTKVVHSERGFLEGIRYVIQREGWRGVYGGAIPTVLRSSANCGIRFSVFHKYRDWMKHKNGERTSLSVANAVAGGVIAGTVSVIATTPIDVVKTRSQALCDGNLLSIREHITQIYKVGGIGGFYHGVIPRLLRVAPGQGIVFSVYHMLSEL
jgi:solute carrier family 25 citrate transporter 1